MTIVVGYSRTFESGPQDTGWVIAGIGENDDSLGGSSWTDPSNVTADDDTPATFTDGAAGSDSEILVGRDFGLSIPGGATILGVETRIQGRDADSDGVGVAFASIGKDVGSANYGDDLEGGRTDFGTAYGDIDYGGSSQLWGLSLTPSDVNNSTFCAAFQVGGDAKGYDCEVDAIWVKVHYET